MIQQTEQLRSSVTGGNAGCPTHHQSYKTKQKCRNRKKMHRKKDNLQSIKHRAQIMEEKYFCILAYKHATDYNGFVSQTKFVA